MRISDSDFVAANTLGIFLNFSCFIFDEGISLKYMEIYGYFQSLRLNRMR